MFGLFRTKSKSRSKDELIAERDGISVLRNGNTLFAKNSKSETLQELDIFSQDHSAILQIAEDLISRHGLPDVFSREKNSGERNTAPDIPLITIDRYGFLVVLDTNAGKATFENEHLRGGLTFDGECLIDFDGVYEIPSDVIKILNESGYDTEYCTPDNSE